jgi:6-phosphogluconolactonase
MILVFRSVADLGRWAAEIFVQAARRAVGERGRFSAALSGGRSPRCAYRLLAEPEFSRRIPWERTHIFWADERLVPLSSPLSSARLAEATFLGRVPIPPENIHRMPVDLPPRRAAANYEATLREFFGGQTPGFDLVLLGLGENGHTASLFPHTRALSEKERWVIPVYRRAERLHRLSLSAPVLSGGKEIVFIVFGASKARALSRTLAATPNSAAYPAKLIRPAAGRLVWLADRRAAALLTKCELAGGN